MKIMNFVFKMMSFAFKTLKFVLKMQVNLTSDDVDPAMGIDPDVIRLVMADGKDPAVSSDKSAYDSISQGLMPAFSAAIWSQLHFIVNFAEDKRRQVAVRAALTNSFGFGGTNASLLFTLMGSDL